MYYHHIQQMSFLKSNFKVAVLHPFQLLLLHRSFIITVATLPRPSPSNPTKMPQAVARTIRFPSKVMFSLRSRSKAGRETS